MHNSYAYNNQAYYNFAYDNNAYNNKDNDNSSIYIMHLNYANIPQKYKCIHTHTHIQANI